MSASYANDVGYNINNINFEKNENLNNNVDLNRNLSTNVYNDVKLNSSENIVVQSVNLNSVDIVSNLSGNNNIENDSINFILKESESSGLILAAGEHKPSKLSQSSVVDASIVINSYVSKHGKLPDFVKISAYKFSMPEYLYLASKTIQCQYKKSNSQINVKYNVKNPKKPTGTNINMKISSSSYYKYATKVVNFISKHSTAPNYLNLGSNKMQYQTFIYIFAKVLAWGKSNGNKLPSSLSLNVKKTSNINKYMPKYVVDGKNKAISSNELNSNYNGELLEKYLSSSKNCQVNDKEIKSLAYQITKKHKSTYDKAKAIFDWVRDKVNYSFYYNTKYGAKKTMTKRVGNCVDQSHLIVALSRASGIASRYVHGTCNFTSGNTYGHVWAQIKVGNTWYVADSTGSKNSFGVIKNWNTNSYKLNGIYDSLSF